MYIHVNREGKKYWNVKVEGLRIGSYQYDDSKNPRRKGNGFSLEGNISFEKEKEEDVIKSIKELGLMTYLRTGSPDFQIETVLGEGVPKKYGKIFSKSYELGLKMLPEAIGRYRKRLRTNKGVARKVLKRTNVLEDFNLLQSKKSVLKSAQEIVRAERARDRSRKSSLSLLNAS